MAFKKVFVVVKVVLHVTSAFKTHTYIRVNKQYRRILIIYATLYLNKGCGEGRTRPA